MFIRHMNNSVWYYRGQYRVRYASHLTQQQWFQQRKAVRDSRTERFMKRRGWGEHGMTKLGLSITFENAKRAIENGDIKFELKILECIGFDIDLYERLAALSG